jgi:hypothetical protein
MTSAQKAIAHADAEQASKEAAKKLEQAKPKISLLHHIAASQAMETGFTVTLLDGTTYKGATGDFAFTDGLSIVHETRRIYFPLTSIKSILIHNPGDK